MVDALNQQYYSDCIQSLLRSFEAVLDEGLGLEGTSYGTEFDIDDLIWAASLTPKPPTPTPIPPTHPSPSPTPPEPHPPEIPE